MPSASRAKTNGEQAEIDRPDQQRTREALPLLDWLANPPQSDLDVASHQRLNAIARLVGSSNPLTARMTALVDRPHRLILSQLAVARATAISPAQMAFGSWAG